jgi:hypothetical protein
MNKPTFLESALCLIIALVCNVAWVETAVYNLTEAKLTYGATINRISYFA